MFCCSAFKTRLKLFPVWDFRGLPSGWLMGKIPLMDRSCIRTAGSWYTTHANSVLCRALALSAYRESRPFDCAFSCCIDLSGWMDSRPSNETLQPKCRRPADQSVCGKTGSWCGFVATENCYAFSDASTRQINLHHILCLCKRSFVLASQDARPRSSHLFPLLSGHSKQSSPCLLSPGRLTKHTKVLFNFQALCLPLLTASFWTGPWET